MSKVESIQSIVTMLRKHGYRVTVFSGRMKMPAALKGLPDLYVMRKGTAAWVEVKLSHANYMRDQMRDAQWEWYHERRGDFGMDLRYAIVQSGDELLTWLAYNSYNEATYIPEYHWERYNKWRRGR